MGFDPAYMMNGEGAKRWTLPIITSQKEIFRDSGTQLTRVRKCRYPQNHTVPPVTRSDDQIFKLALELLTTEIRSAPEWSVEEPDRKP